MEREIKAFGAHKTALILAVSDVCFGLCLNVDSTCDYSNWFTRRWL